MGVMIALLRSIIPGIKEPRIDARGHAFVLSHPTLSFLADWLAPLSLSLLRRGKLCLCISVIHVLGRIFIETAALSLRIVDVKQTNY